MGELRIKRIYEAASPDDGARVLVDRIWPRGMRKDAADLAEWARDIAPSPALRRWFNHDPARWQAFQERYRQELDENPAAVDRLRDLLRRGRVTLLYGARDETHNNAVALAHYLATADDRH